MLTKYLLFIAIAICNLTGTCQASWDRPSQDQCDIGNQPVRSGRLPPGLPLGNGKNSHQQLYNEALEEFRRRKAVKPTTCNADPDKVLGRISTGRPPRWNEPVPVATNTAPMVPEIPGYDTENDLQTISPAGSANAATTTYSGGAVSDVSPNSKPSSAGRSSTTASNSPKSDPPSLPHDDWTVDIRGDLSFTPSADVKMTKEKSDFMRVADTRREFCESETADLLKISRKNRILVVGESRFLFSRILCKGVFQGQSARKCDKKRGRQRLKSFGNTSPNVFSSHTTKHDIIRPSKKEKRLIYKNCNQITTNGWGQIMRDVDATNLGKLRTSLKGRKFDRIIWTFPYDTNYDNKDGCEHGGKLKSQKNGELVSKFFKSINESGILDTDGRIYLLLTDKQCSDWKLIEGAKKFGFKPDAKYPMYFGEQLTAHVQGKDVKVSGCYQFPGYFATKTNGLPWDPQDYFPKMFTFVVDKTFEPFGEAGVFDELPHGES